MKVVAKKKTIVILIISFVLLLLAGLGFLFKDKVRNIHKTFPFVKLDKYTHLVDDCEAIKSSGGIVLQCQGVLKNVQNKPDKECIKVEVSVKDDTDLREEILCVNSGRLDWKNPYEKEDGYFPVSIELLYEKSAPFKANLRGIKLAVLDDHTLYKLFEKNKQLRTLENMVYDPFILNNFDFTEFDLFYKYPVISTRLSAFVLKSINTNNNQIQLEYEGEIKGDMYRLSLQSNRFLHRKYNGTHFSIIHPHNYNLMQIGKSYDLFFLSSKVILPEELNTHCPPLEEIISKTSVIEKDMLENKFFTFCVFKPENLEDMYTKDDIEKYIDLAINSGKNNDINNTNSRSITLDKSLILYEVIEL